MTPQLPEDWLVRLCAHDPGEEPPESGPQAAVAALLRPSDAGPQVLLMQRVACEGDRWSGQVSLPGGRAEPADADLAATAVRETHEEVGVDLSAEARLLARFARFQAIARGGRVDLQITPFVFVAERAVDPHPGPEADATFWLPLEAAAEGRLDDTYLYSKDGVDLPLPCWRYDGRVIWGMTFRVVTRLLAIARG